MLLESAAAVDATAGLSVVTVLAAATPEAGPTGATRRAVVTALTLLPIGSTIACNPFYACRE